MSKVKNVSNKITKDQLKKITDQQTSLSDLLKNIGVLDVQKMNIHSKIKELSVEIETTKKQLEDEYGSVNIDLKDGSYSEIEKENEK